MLEPKLRFNEFSDTWTTVCLSDICIFSKGSLLSKSDLSKHGIPCILYGELYTIYNETIEYITSRTKVNKDLLKMGKSNDVLIPSSGETAIDIATASCLMIDNVACGGDLNILSPIKDNGIFISYQLNTCKRNSIAKIAQGASVVHIYNDGLKKIKVDIPTISEQEKIATFISLVNRKISLQEKKIALLKDYKKGLISNLLNRNLISNILTINDLLIEFNEKSTINNEYSVISSTVQGLYLQSEYFNREIASKDNIGYKILKKNQIVLSPQNLWMGNINYNDKFEVGIVSPSYKIYNVNSSHSSSFIALLMKSERALFEYKLASEQGASVVRRNLNLELFNEIIFNVPCYEIQIRTMEIIDSFNCKLNYNALKLKKIKEIKQSLLQQMFI